MIPQFKVELAPDHDKAIKGQGEGRQNQESLGKNISQLRQCRGTSPKLPPWLPTSVLSRPLWKLSLGIAARSRDRAGPGLGGSTGKAGAAPVPAGREGRWEQQALGCQQAVGHRLMLRQTGSLSRNPKDSFLGLVPLGLPR